MSSHVLSGNPIGLSRTHNCSNAHPKFINTSSLPKRWFGRTHHRQASLSNLHFSLLVFPGFASSSTGGNTASSGRRGLLITSGSTLGLKLSQTLSRRAACTSHPQNHTSAFIGNAEKSSMSRPMHYVRRYAMASGWSPCKTGSQPANRPAPRGRVESQKQY